MDTELFELCKEVYEKTGWSADLELDNYYSAQYDNVRADLEPIVKYVLGKSPKTLIDDYNKEYKPIPLYTSDYLLEKLPNRTRLKKFLTGYKAQWTKDYRSGATATGKNYTTHRVDIAKESDTPLKALLKLTLALHKAGELK